MSPFGSGSAKGTDAGAFITRGGAISGTFGEYVLIESFEDQDMGEWTIPNSEVDFVTSNVVDGQVAMKNDGFIDGESTTGLPAYYSRGDGDFYAYLHPTTSTDDYSRIGFGAAGETQSYECRLEWGTDSFVLRNTDGGPTLVDISNIGWDLTHYQLKVTWDDGSLGGSAGDINVLIEEWDNANKQTTSNKYVDVSANDDNGGLDAEDGFVITLASGNRTTLDHFHKMER